MTQFVQYQEVVQDILEVEGVKVHFTEGLQFKQSYKDWSQGVGLEDDKSVDRLQQKINTYIRECALFH